MDSPISAVEIVNVQNFAVLQSCAKGTSCLRTLKSLTVTFSAESVPTTIPVPTQASIDRSTSISHAISPLAQLIALAPMLNELSIHPSSMPTSVSAEDPDRTSAPATARGGTPTIPQSFIEVLPSFLLSLAVNRISLGSIQLASVCGRLPLLERLYVMLGRAALGNNNEETVRRASNFPSLAPAEARYAEQPGSKPVEADTASNPPPYISIFTGHRQCPWHE